MGESPFMRDGWAVLQPTLTAQPSRTELNELHGQRGQHPLLFCLPLGLHCLSVTGVADEEGRREKAAAANRTTSTSSEQGLS